MNKRSILLIYPRMGVSGSLVQHLPLSILYAAVDSLKAGFHIELVDLRVIDRHWKEILNEKIDPETTLVGISVMTGTPILNALELSRWIKEHYPRIPVVWGGPHATFNGTEILDESAVDYVISGYGSKSLALLAKNLSGEDEAPMLYDIPGLIFRNKTGIKAVPPENQFEFIDYRDIPYWLIANDLPRYGQLDSKERIFSMYSVMGCPYHCAFCSSPAQYRYISPKYQPLDAYQVVDHIQYVMERYAATYIYFIDDDSFVNLAHVKGIIEEIKRRKLQIKLGFRGARINEIKRMDDDYLSMLADAGTNIMHIGAESGSQRMLDMMKKDCTVEDIVDINRKMARHHEINTAYNWVVGIPGETMEDLAATRKLILKLIKENPSTLIFIPNKFRPLCGTELYDLAISHGYRKPIDLSGWIEREAEGDYRPPWYTTEQADMIRMMQVTSYFIDNKVFRVDTGKTFKYTIIRFLARIYAPIARFRFRYGVTAGIFIEYYLFNWFSMLSRTYKNNPSCVE